MDSGEEGRAQVGESTAGFAFVRIPLRCQLWVSAAVVAALVLPPVLDQYGHGHVAGDPAFTGMLLVALSIVNVELGRMLEGGVSNSQRPHKGLSAWAFATALLLPTWWLIPVVVITYAHARWRGLRAPLWKWIGSAAYVVLAGLAASVVAHLVMGDEVDLMDGRGRAGLVAVVAAAAAFLLVETVLFHGSAYLNSPDDEVWLRETLSTPSFYLTEAGVLLVGGLSAAIWTGGGWFVVLLAPVYLITQRAALHEPLRRRAEYDEKTGALRFESWRRLAMASVERCRRRDRPWCVLFADLDNFKAFNETWGHLVGDEALGLAADAIRAELRDDHDLVARFGGEEFCIFLPDASAEDAAGIAERIRCRVAETQIREAAPVTISIGLAAVPADDRGSEFVRALTAADRALFIAKQEGRDRVRVVVLDAA